MLLSLWWLLLLIPEVRRFETFLPLLRLLILLFLPCLMVIMFFFALLIAILIFPYCFFQSSRFIKLNSVFVRLRKSTQETLDFHLLTLDIPGISQRLHGLLSQSQLMKFFDLVMIVPVKEEFLLEIILELFPHNFPFINLLHFPAVFPPYGCPASQLKMATLSFIFPEQSWTWKYCNTPVLTPLH